MEAERRDIIFVVPKPFAFQGHIRSINYLEYLKYNSTPCFDEMADFTDRENDELLSFVKYLKAHGVTPIEPLKTSIEELHSPDLRTKCPLKVAAEAISLYNMFASFLSCGKHGYVIAVTGGFGADGWYHIVGAGNAGRKGVRRPSDELCAGLAQACTKFISSNAKPLNPDNMSGVLVAALDICHAEVARRLKTIDMDAFFTTHTAQIARTLQTLVSDNLERWKELGSGEKTTIATLYGRCLEFASYLWERIKDSENTQFRPHKNNIREFNNIAKGLYLLHRFPRGTRVVFDWPQGPINGDRFKCQPANAKAVLWQTVIEDFIKESARSDKKLQKKMRTKWKEAIGESQWVKAIPHTTCQLHCEIYLALHVLFSKSNVRFHSFLVEEGKRVFPIGCSKTSCIACWDILLELSRQDSWNHPLYICRTLNSHGKCYPTWGLTPHVESLPPSLLQSVTGPKRQQMLKSLNHALRSTHQRFKQRVKSST